MFQSFKVSKLQLIKINKYLKKEKLIQIMSNIVLINSIAELKSLKRSNLVKVVYETIPLHKCNYAEQIGAYHGIDTNYFFQFIVPKKIGIEDYLTEYKVFKTKIQFKNGIIIINEDQSIVRSHTKDNTKYAELNQTLIMAGLR